MSRFVRRDRIAVGTTLSLTADTDVRTTSASSAAMLSAQALLGTLAARGTGLVAHADRVAGNAELVSYAFDFTEDRRHELHLVALLHDVGMLLVPATVVDHHHDLQSVHWENLRNHATRGEAILAAIPALEAFAPLIRATSEHWDGTGGPDGLRHEAIPFASRIVAACDAWDTVSHGADALDPETAAAALRAEAGVRLCPTATNALLDVVGLA